MKYVFNIIVIALNILILALALKSGDIHTHIKYHFNTLLIGIALGTTLIFMVDDSNKR